MPEVKPHERAGLFASIFVVAYLAFGSSAIIAGYIATAVGIEPVAVGFAIVLVTVSLVGVLAAGIPLRRARRRSLGAQRRDE